MKNKRIKCIDCNYVRPDNHASVGDWTAYECGNCDSEYYRCLLNVDRNGNKQQEITWIGCENGVRGGGV